jgi:hypothetical protein
VGGAAEAPAGVDEAGDVVAVGVGVLVDGVVVEAGRAVAGCFGGFGGVLGEVAGDHVVGDLVAAAQGDAFDEDLVAPGDAPSFGLVGVRGRGERGVRDGVVDGVVEVDGGDPWWGCDDGVRIGGVDAVEAQQRVEVDRRGSEIRRLCRARPAPGIPCGSCRRRWGRGRTGCGVAGRVWLGSVRYSVWCGATVGR